MTKYLKHLKTFEFHNSIMRPFFFIMTLYLGLLRQQQLSKSMSKLTGLHSIFRKNSNYGANIGFHALTFARSLGRWRCLKPMTTALVVIQVH